ncbi:MAG: hypothetical protein U0793_17370 [Gemmataceae bacterium]
MNRLIRGGHLPVLVLSPNPTDGTDDRLRTFLRDALGAPGAEFVSWDAFARQAGRSDAGVVIVVLGGDRSTDRERGLEILRLARRNPGTPVLALGPVSDSKFILRVLQQGAATYIDDAELEAELPAALQRLGASEEPEAAGKVIAVLGVSGGSGTSTLAVNLAAVMARDYGKAALFDLKPGRGDLATLLDLKPAYTLADICLNVARVDPSIFEKVLIKHASDVHLLAAPQVFEDARIITAQGVNHALNLARREFPLVVIDQEDAFHEEQLVSLKQADRVLLVARLDFTSIRNIRRTLDQLQARDIPRESIRLVINRQGQPNELSATDAEEVLGGRPASYIPDDPKTINGANNTGVPAVVKSPQTRIAQAITKLARDLSGYGDVANAEKPAKGRSLFGLFGAVRR